MMTPHLGDREPPVGTVVNLQPGLYAADRVFSGGGAYVTVWKPIGHNAPSIVSCRGTASRKTATGALMSVINDVLPQLGLYGVKTIWPDLKRYLDAEKFPQVHVMGKSLGGAHAQYLTALISGLTETKVTNLDTYCSTGAEKTNGVMKRIMREKNIEAPLTTIYRNKGAFPQKEYDGVIFVGGKHFGVKGKTVVKDITPKNQGYEKVPTGFWDKVFILLKSFGRAHLRQNSLQHEFGVHVIANTKEAVREGRELESIRRKIGWVFTVFIFGFFGTQNFEEYYNSQVSSPSS